MKISKGIRINNTIWDLTNTIVGNKRYFTYDEAMEIADRLGKRLPNKDDVEDLLKLEMIADNNKSLNNGAKFYIDKNSKGAVPIMPPYIKDHFWYYQEFKNISQKIVVDIISAIQKWNDTGISMELIFNLNLPEVNAKYIYETLIDAWKKDLKTVYYIRSIQKNSSDVSAKEECISCAG